MGRIKGASVGIDDKSVSVFFRNRIKKDLPYRYNYTNYQDANPELALLRDKKEKDKIVSMLELEDGGTVLDIGCGVGRWGDFFAEKTNCTYVGIDYCEEILGIAKKHFKSKGNVILLCAKFQELKEKIIENDIPTMYDFILINGVMMYINDEEIQICLNTVRALLKPGGKIYIKESVGRQERLTLKNIYSEELMSNYSAIYRSIDEYNELWRKYWSNIHIYSEGELWDDKIQHRSETSTYYWLFKSS